MKKKTYGGLAVMLVLAGLIIGYLSYTKVSSLSDDVAETKIAAAEEMAHAVDFYIRTGESEVAAREKAEKYMKERDELYQEAIEAGYTVTDEEVWEYLEELKKIIETADNKEDVLAEIARFPSEEDYWEFEFHVYQKDLPIQKYREAVKAEKK